MIVQGWIIVGTGPNLGLPQQRYCGAFKGAVPEASAYTTGDWIVWHPAPGVAGSALVCVQIPI